MANSGRHKRLRKPRHKIRGFFKKFPHFYIFAGNGEGGRSSKRPRTPIRPLRTDEGKWAKSDTQRQMYWQNTLQMSLNHIILRCQKEEEDKKKKKKKSYTPLKLLASWKPQSGNLTEVRFAINHLRPKKAPGHDLITGRILHKLPDIGVRAIYQIFNSVLRTVYFLGQWKVSQIIIILKPRKPAEETKSYRDISFLQILLKLNEKLFLTRIKPTLQEKRIIPDHLFGFGQATYIKCQQTEWLKKYINGNQC